MTFILDPIDLAAIEAQITHLGWPIDLPLLSADSITGGNMNKTVRIRSSQSSHILKQSRPFVVKYPSIPAPIERATIEAAFYQAIAPVAAIASHMPLLHGYDPESHLLWLEDISGAADQTQPLTTSQAIELTAYLNALHHLSLPAAQHATFANRAMRSLNHEHQYDFPLRPDNGLDLDAITPGLSAAAADLKADTAYCERVHDLGKLYLADGPVLLHGDFFPGSWLSSSKGLHVIDPEFCFLGPAEYDLGIFLAHLEFMGKEELWPLVMEHYRHDIDWTLARAFAGAELMRRLIGVAQLPLTANLDQKSYWLSLSRTFVCAA